MSVPLEQLSFQRLSKRPAMLGESPVWDARRDCLWWVDGFKGELRRCRAGHADELVHTFEQHIGCVALAQGGDLLIALEHQLLRFDPERMQSTAIWFDVKADPSTRLNDGTTDRLGHFWCAEMGRQAQPAGRLLSWASAGRVTVQAQGLSVGNGVAFSPTGDVVYFADTPARKVYRAQRIESDGSWSSPVVHMDTETLGSGVDGATVDAQGNLWCVLIRQAQIACFAPGGQLLRLVAAPVDLPSSICFGGPGMRTLFLTSIRDSGSGRAVSQHPLGGHLFALDGLGVSGISDTPWRE